MLRIAFCVVAVISLLITVLVVRNWARSYQPNPDNGDLHGQWFFVNDESHILQDADGSIGYYFVDPAGVHAIWKIPYWLLAAVFSMLPALWLALYVKSKVRQRGPGFEVLAGGDTRGEQATTREHA